jgi:hypothetical protein
MISARIETSDTKQYEDPFIRIGLLIKVQVYFFFSPSAIQWVSNKRAGNGPVCSRLQSVTTLLCSYATS